jgi:hypothetical protein
MILACQCERLVLIQKDGLCSERPTAAILVFGLTALRSLCRINSALYYLLSLRNCGARFTQQKRVVPNELPQRARPSRSSYNRDLGS